jgi:hypothetical protein
VNVVGQLIIPAIVVKKTIIYYSLVDLTNTLSVLLKKIEEMYEQQLQEKPLLTEVITITSSSIIIILET